MTFGWTTTMPMSSEIRKQIAVSLYSSLAVSVLTTTPGFMMTVKSLLAENPNPSDAEVRAALSSNLCRCTGYSQMFEAIRSAIVAEQKG